MVWGVCRCKFHIYTFYVCKYIYISKTINCLWCGIYQFAFNVGYQHILEISVLSLQMCPTVTVISHIHITLTPCIVVSISKKFSHGSHFWRSILARCSLGREPDNIFLPLVWNVISGTKGYRGQNDTGTLKTNKVILWAWLPFCLFIFAS